MYKRDKSYVSVSDSCRVMSCNEKMSINHNRVQSIEITVLHEYDATRSYQDFETFVIRTHSNRNTTYSYFDQAEDHLF